MIDGDGKPNQQHSKYLSKNGGDCAWELERLGSVSRKIQGVKNEKGCSYIRNLEDEKVIPLLPILPETRFSRLTNNSLYDSALSCGIPFLWWKDETCKVWRESE